MKINININKIYIYFFAFLLFYFPPIVKFNCIHFLSFVTLITSFNSLKDMTNTFIRSKLYIFTGFYSIGIIYLLFQTVLLDTSSFNIIYQLILLSIEIPLCLTFLLNFFSKKNYSFNEVIHILIIVSFIQGIITMFAYFIPSLQTGILNLLVENGLSSVNQDFIGFRSYGLATNLTSTTPAFQAIMAIFCFNLGLKSNKKYFLYSIPIIFSCFINSRTAIVIFLFGFLFIITSLLVGNKNKLKYIFNGILLFFAIILFYEYVFMPYLKTNSYSTYIWISGGISEVISFINGESIGYFEVANSFILFPKGLSILFGSKDIIVSDIGYILNVWTGGLLFCFIIYFPVFLAFLKTISHKLSFDKMIMFIYIFLCLWMLEFKGSIIRQNEVIILLMLIFGLLEINKRKWSNING